MNRLDENDLKDLSKNIKQLRQTAGLTQEELANMVGVTRQTINSIETNKKVASTTLFLAIMGVFMFASSMNPVLNAVVETLKVDKVFKKLINKK